MAAAALLSPPVPVEFLEDFSFDELYAKARTLPPRSAVLYLPVFQDRLGVRQIPRDVAAKLAEVATAPIFAHHDSFLGAGVVGGYLISAPRVGSLMARIALGLSLPQNSAEIDAIVKGYQFDDRQLQRWGIADDKLPNPHTIIGRQASLWTIYRWPISGILVVLALQFFLIVLLLRSRAERRRALAALVDERTRLEQRVVERTAELAESESHLRTIIATEPECIKIIDAEGRLIQMNPAGLEMIEADALAQVVGHPVLEVIAPEYRVGYARLHQRVLAGETMHMQYEVLGLKGGRRWLETHAVPMQSHGQVVHLAVTRDIAERKRNEAELEQSRVHLQSSIELLRHVTAQVPGMVYQYRLRPDGRSCFPYASAGIRDIYGLTADEVREDAAPVFAVQHPDDRELVVAAIQASALSGQPWRQRYRVRFADGAIRWRQGSALPEAEADGSCLWHGFVSDATADVAAEEGLRLAASVFANVQEGISITDTAGLITDVNPAFTRITGYTRDEVLGRSPKILASGHQDAAFYAQMWQSLAESGAWRGEVWNRNKAGEVYPELLSIAAVKDSVGQISHYIGSFSDITHLKEREAQLDRLAHYDPLTTLPNRRLLGDRLRQAIAQTRRAGKIAAICLLDLDNFKPINDRYGHAAGDAVLVEAARRLAACVREDDTVARLGGDEFVLLLLNLEWVEECDAILSRVLQELAAPIDFNEHRLGVSASIGVTLFPQDDNASDLLLRHADHALYQAKQAGRNRYHLFDAEHGRLVRDYRRLIDDLSESLHNDRFVLYYQPKVEMTSGRVIGAEALIRWRHPERGLLAPAQFLYAIAGSALEIPLGAWVLNSALKQVAQWKSQGWRLPVSINLSLRDLQQTAFAENLAQALARHPGVVGADLEIEMLESAALANIEQVASIVRSCQALGVRVALDDFGSGYSSLAYFKHLPVDVLKIDQVLVRDMRDDPEDRAIVEGIIKIAQAFNREVIAEGVENIEQGHLLLQLGCRFAQGYVIARPMPADSLAPWVEKWQGVAGWRV
jgi:diguanylate cyclase (GGDEF)-like protein/PAS domain S-box-containing protein